MSRALERLRVLALGLILAAALVAPMLWISYQLPAPRVALPSEPEPLCFDERYQQLVPVSYGTDC